MTPNYVSNSSTEVSQWCTCDGSGNERQGCQRILNMFSNNMCLREFNVPYFREQLQSIHIVYMCIIYIYIYVHVSSIVAWNWNFFWSFLFISKNHAFIHNISCTLARSCCFKEKKITKINETLHFNAGEDTPVLLWWYHLIGWWR